MCWAACDRLARIAAHLGLTERGAHWSALAEDMRARILHRAWHPQRRVLASTLDGDMLDATVLLLPELGLIDAHDERFLATLDAVERELREGDLIFRYRHGDDFGEPHNAFTVCSFWYVNALAAAGRRVEAREIFERLLQRRNRLGLLSEDIDPRTGEQWGNYPQTYSMVGVILCARRLSRSWEEVV
jgi:GH15 family glucan-1,4-alpha-glucosidase